MAGGHGGKREGSGRKAGAAWRPEARALRAEAREKLAAIVGSSRDPLEFVCALATDPEQDVALRLSAASIALPYLHPRLSAMASVTAKVPDGADPQAVLDTVLNRIARLAPPPTIDAECEPAETP